MTRRRGDAGVTLVELLVTISLLGIAFPALLTGLATSVVTSDQVRAQARADALLRTLAEQVTAAPYSSCRGAGPAYREGLGVPDGYAVAVTVRTWDPVAGRQDCRSPDPGLQLVELELATSGGPATRAVLVRLSLVKRDPGAVP